MYCLCSYFCIACFISSLSFIFFFFFNDTATTEIYTLSLHDALPISAWRKQCRWIRHRNGRRDGDGATRSEEHTSELQSLTNLVCRLLLEKKKKKKKKKQQKTTHKHKPTQRKNTKRQSVRHTQPTNNR